MKKLWVFGDSFSVPFFILNKKYFDFTNGKAKFYGDILSEKLNVKLINKGKLGTDNYTIFYNIIDELHNIELGDIIIIGWTDVMRYRMVNNGNWESLRIENDHILGEKAHKIMILNRLEKQYINEIDKMIHIIKLLLKNNTIINWSWCKMSELKNLSFKYNLNDFNSINDETNELICDSHYGVNSHIKLSNLMLKEIKRGLVQTKPL